MEEIVNIDTGWIGILILILFLIGIIFTVIGIVGRSKGLILAGALLILGVISFFL